MSYKGVFDFSRVFSYSRGGEVVSFKKGCFEVSKQVRPEVGSYVRNFNLGSFVEAGLSESDL